MTRPIWFGLGLLAATALSARSAEAQAVVPHGTEVARATEPAADIPYDSSGRRDPFRPPRAGSTTIRTGETRTPLQRYEIGQLRLVAVIYDTTEPRGVVEDNQGLGYIVRAGTPIGPNGGVVRDVERGRLLIDEDSIDFYGEHHRTSVVMELRTAERGKR
jgi:type IV pilus assembly protein PilP